MSVGTECEPVWPSGKALGQLTVYTHVLHEMFKQCLFL